MSVNQRPHGQPPLGTGELHCALEAARELAALNSFCASQGCSPAEVSADGRRLHIPRVFDLMRARGFDVAQPVRAEHQPRKGFTGWLVHVRMPGAQFDIGFFTPNDVPAGPTAKKARQLNAEHA
jgi:hypothetical protein